MSIERYGDRRIQCKNRTFVRNANSRNRKSGYNHKLSMIIGKTQICVRIAKGCMICAKHLNRKVLEQK